MTNETGTRTHKALKALKIFGYALLVSGFTFNYYATASIAKRWDWETGIPFNQMIPIHANGALYGLAFAVIGAGILSTLSAKTKSGRSVMSGLFLGLLIGGGCLLEFGPLF